MSRNDVRQVSIEGEVAVGEHVFGLGRTSSVEDCGMINGALSLYPVPCIVLNDAAWALPEHIRMAIIGHELGHYFLNHASDAVRGRRMADEIEADHYAIRFAGLPAIRQLLLTMHKSCLKHGIDPTEAIVRLAALPACPKAKKAIPGRRNRRRRNRRK